MKNMTDILKRNHKGEKTLMVIFPHPDDESVAAAGLLVAAKQHGWKTVVVTLTHGEAGKVHIHPNGRSTKEVRLSELKKASKIISVDELIVGDFDDGKLRETVVKWKPWLVKKLQEYNPTIVVTYDHAGITGHPDHISLSLEMLKLTKRLARKNEKLMLFWVSMPKQLKDKLLDSAISSTASCPTHELNLGPSFVKKWLAIRAHKSQKTLQFWQMFYFLVIMRREWYYKVSSKKKYNHKFVDFKI